MKKKIYQTEHRPWPEKTQNIPLLPLGKPKMIYTIVSVKDRALNAYGRPIFVHTQGQAIRSFQDEINRPAENNEMHRHPEDYDLYFVGTFDDQKGEFSPNGPEQIKQIASGKQLKYKNED